MDDDLADFVQSRYSTLLRRAFLLMGDIGLAEDLVQDGLAKLWLASSRRPIANPDAYVRTVMLHDSIARWRRRARLRETPTHSVPERESGSDPSQTAGDHELVWRALMGLPPRQRAIMVLRYYENLTEPEICAVMTISAGTVRSQSSKARARLRALIGDHEGVPL